MNTKHKSQSGMNLVIETEGWAQVQASWRFYNNIDVTINTIAKKITQYHHES